MGPPNKSCVLLYENNFNPHPRKEGDGFSDDNTTTVHNFNPHPREEGDSVTINISIRRTYFNPHPRKEGDCKIA